MPAPKVQIIDGIQYPRDVPPPPGLPEGWTAVEQAYSPASRYHGQIYTRFRSLDGKHRNIAGPKQVCQLYADENGIDDWETVYSLYQQAQEEKKQKQAQERELKGKADGQRREDMVALFRSHFEELKGEHVFGFPGWKCRWEFLPESGQCPKTFTDPEGIEFKLLKDLECKFGMIIEREGQVPDDLAQMVQAGIDNFEAHSLFHTGSARAKECQGSVELDASTPGGEVKSETKEERAQRMLQNRKAKKRQKTQQTYYSASQEDYLTWGVTIAPVGTETADIPSDPAITIRRLLLARGFKDKDSMLLHVAASSQANRYADALTGFYARQGTAENKMPHYQRVKLSSIRPGTLVPVECHLYWSDANSRWEMGTMRNQKDCCAFSTEDKPHPAGTQSWRLLRGDFGIATTSPAVVNMETMDANAPSEPTSKKQKTTSDASPGILAAATAVAQGNSAVKDATANRTAFPGKGSKKSVSATEARDSVNAASVSIKAEKTAEEPTKKVEKPAEEPTVKVNENWQRWAAKAQWDGVYHTEKLWKWEERLLPKERPAHWPSDVEVAPEPWVSWLPEGWGQCKKVTSGGRLEMKYVTPEGKIIHNKEDVKKMVGSELPDRPRVAAAKTVSWPDWLPKDWRITMKDQNGTQKKIYVTPCETRFYWGQKDVLKSIAQCSVGQTGGILKVRPPA